jgi:aryl-phospho-beta-D-glucosidase BglC (GH1 family)
MRASRLGAWALQGGVLAVLVLASVSVSGQGQGIAFERAAHLKRGINLSMWYAQDYDYSAKHLAEYTTPDDFRLVKATGFDHARLSINPEPLMLAGKPDAFDPEAIARLDKTVAEITATGLVVILDIHPEMPFMDALAHGDASAANLITFWKTFARHYASTDPAKVYFEVLNEPHFDDGYRWAGIQASVIPAIRTIAPRHTIIATGAKWGGVEGLKLLEPVRDDNIIYSFHDYDPMTFTHQGATWSGEFLKPLRNVPYPSSEQNVAPLLDLETTDGGKKDLAWYGKQQWDAKKVDEEIAQMAGWGSSHGVPVWCGEFGVYKKYAAPAMRAAWLHDMRVAFEAHNIGWSMWDYQGGFALVTKDGGKTTVDAAVANALGLKAPAK